VEYAQVRLQARYGQRPDEALWHRLSGTQELGPLLEAAHASGLRRWVAGLDAGASLHDMESGLRARLRDHVDEVARWMPEAWQSATRWAGRLIDLPALAYLARGEPPLAWMAKDTLLAPFAAAPDEERAAKVRSGALSFLGPVWDEVLPAHRAGDARARGALALGAWRDAWHRAWPQQGEESALALAQFEAAVVVHLDRFGASTPEHTAAVRREFAHRLQAMFRRFSLLPAVAFVYLALTALDLERLRAELVRRGAPCLGNLAR
jgi:hypothetical protein